MNHEQIINDVTQEIFSTMVMMGITAGTPFERPDGPHVDGVSGVISLEGKYHGLLAIHLPRQSALDVGGSFLDLELEEIDADVCDAVGELANMLAGSLKAALDPGGSDIQLSMPATFYGDEYVVDRLPDATNVTVPFYLDEGDFFVELQFQDKS